MGTAHDAGSPGDRGMTRLGDGRAVAKDNPVLNALGTLDELSAALGLLRVALAGETPTVAWITRVQEDLVALGGALAGCAADGTGGPDGGFTGLRLATLAEDPRFVPARPLTTFVLPGVNEAEARAHAARALCRRAERETVRLTVYGAVPDGAMPYLNRLATRLFGLACRLAERQDGPRPAQGS